MNKWALSTESLQASSRCLTTWAHGTGHMDASVNRMHNLERRCIFSRSGNFNSIWQLPRFQDDPVTVSGYGQERGWGYQRRRFGDLGGDVVMLAPGTWAQISFRGRNLWSWYFRSHKDLNGMGVRREREREKAKRDEEMSFVDTKAIG